MSNSLAVSTVTAVLTTMVQTAMADLDVVPQPVVAAGDLDDTGDNARVFVHLLRISRNASRAVDNLPTRGADGSVRARPCVALDLHYLVVFRGTTPHETQLMLAAAAAQLEAAPIVTTAWVDAAALEHPEVADNDLADAERVRITPDPLSVDELSRVWTLYSVGMFAPTLALVAGPVLVEAGPEPGSPLPVRRVGLGAHPFRAVRVDQVAGPDGPGAPVRSANPMPDVTVLGTGFQAGEGETIDVLVDDAVVPSTPVDDATLVLPALPVAPGQHVLRVRRTSPPLDPAVSTTERVEPSSPVGLLVTPTIVSVTPQTAAGSGPGLRSGDVRVRQVPPLPRTATTRLLLDSRTLDPSVSLVLVVDLPAGAGPFAEVPYVVDDAPAGDYRVTLEVDGARSVPPVDAAGHYVLSEVTL